MAGRPGFEDRHGCCWNRVRCQFRACNTKEVDVATRRIAGGGASQRLSRSAVNIREPGSLWQIGPYKLAEPPKDMAVDGPVDITGGLGIPFAYSGGVFGLSANYNTATIPDMAGILAHVPPGWVRDYAQVTLQPGSGGWAGVLQWASDDPDTLDFFFHVGCPAFQGGVVLAHVYIKPA
jgi:hypothetical protein